MIASPFDHPFLSSLLGDEEVGKLMGPEAELAAMLRFEAALARAEAEEGVIPAAAAAAIEDLCGSFHPDVAALNQGAARDGVVVPDLVRQLRAGLAEPHRAHLHFGATSQDVVDTALVLRLKELAARFYTRLGELETALARLERDFGGKALMGRTRMQDALPITAGDRIAAWRQPLARHRARFAELAPRLFVLQLGGAVGTLDKLGDQGPAVARRLAGLLDLATPQRSWHTTRDGIAEFGGWLALVTGSLGKMGQDIALMAQNALGDIRLAGGGGSSAMPHKENPVGAEVLVALARYNAALAGALAGAMVHEQERSGAAWTLEWLVLPQMLAATGAALATAGRLVGQIRSIGAQEDG